MWEHTCSPPFPEVLLLDGRPWQTFYERNKNEIITFVQLSGSVLADADYRKQRLST